jgi:outer membrane protein assembly factor BamD
MKSHHLTIILFFLIAALGCTEFGKISKSKDPKEKLDAAIKYYNEGQCEKSIVLLDELVGVTRGTALAEDVFYYYAKTHLCRKDYYMGNYYFKNFHKTFNISPRAEECLFLAALCSYNLSPTMELDQQDTRAAIDEFQLFLDNYPRSNLRDSANHMINLLSRKIEVKEFEIAELYYITENYKAAVTALKRYRDDHPNAPEAEEAMYLIVKSYYEFAAGSIEEKKLERFQAAKESYLTFAAAYPQSKRLREAEAYFMRSIRELEKLKKTGSQQ